MEEIVGINGNCRTTAMGIMPHEDVEKALQMALSLDIPYWPQLPRVSFYEDMYAQVSEGFPGITVDVERERVDFNHSKFADDIVAYSERMENPESFEMSSEYSVVFHRFLEQNLAGYTSIRGQSTGPVSFGFKIVDENRKPIIYNEDVRALLYDFIQRKVNAQYAQMAAMNPNAFVWLDEPGLGWAFNSLTGYDDTQVRRDYRSFMSGVAGPKALHLCANVNLPYLLDLGLDIISFDAYQLEMMPKWYAQPVADFIAGGGVMCWGIVPTNSVALAQENPEILSNRLIEYWEVVASESDVSAEQIARQSLIAPARCCLKNISAAAQVDEPAGCGTCVSGSRISGAEEEIVEGAFGYLSKISEILRERFRL